MISHPRTQRRVSTQFLHGRRELRHVSATDDAAIPIVLDEISRAARGIA